MNSESIANELYKVRLDFMFNEGGRTDHVFRKTAREFLSWEKKWQKIEDLYAKFIEHNDTCEVLRHEFSLETLKHTFIVLQHQKEHLIIKSSKELAIELNRMTSNSYEFQLPKGCKINQDIEVNYNLSGIHKNLFPYFFAFRLAKIQSESLEDFLFYHLKTTFENNKVKYRQFLSLLSVDDYPVLIGRNSYLNLWIQNNFGTVQNGFALHIEPTPQVKGPRKKNKKKAHRKPEEITLESIFEEMAGDFRNEFLNILSQSGRGTKTEIFKQVIAYLYSQKRIKKLNASALSRLFHSEFGSELGNDLESIRKALRKEDIEEISVKTWISDLLVKFN